MKKNRTLILCFIFLSFLFLTFAPDALAKYITSKEDEINLNIVSPTFTITYELNEGEANNPTEYKYHSADIVLNDATKVGYTFDGWTGDNGTTPEKGVTIVSGSTGNKTYEANFTANDYTIRFNANAPTGTTAYGSMSDLEMTYDTPKNLTENAFTVTSYIFDGWNTKSDGSGDAYEDEEEVNNLATEGVIDLYATWIPDSAMICKKATVLHTETCESTDTAACLGAGYAQHEKITYGKIINSDTLVAGDAFDCNVDGTGYNQRFYYLRTLDNKAVLISNYNFEGDGQGFTKKYIYTEAITKLPTSEQWSRLPVTFEIQTDDYRPARFITLDELYAITGKTSLSQLTTTGSLDSVNFLFENTGYARNDDNVRSTVWVEREDNKTTRYHKQGRHINIGDPGTENGVRPVIEVPLDLIDDTYVIRFNPNGGSIDSEYVNIRKGSSLGTLPTPTNDSYTFGGWYTSLEFTTRINANAIPTGYLTYYAKWIKPVSDAVINKTSYSLEIGNSEQIIISNASEIEDHSFTSSNPSIASVDSDGVITALSEGTVTITITGLESTTTKTVTVDVVDQVTSYTVDFEVDGGEAVESMEVPKNTAIGTLPSTTKEGFDLDGWYTTSSYTTKVTEETIIDSNKTFYAKWIPVDAVVEMNGVFYPTIQKALNEAPTSKTTIKVVKDITIDPTNDPSSKAHYTVTSNTSTWADLHVVNNDKDIVIDFDGHTITAYGPDNLYIVRSKANVEIKNGTIINASTKGAVESNGKTMIIRDMTITATGTRQAAYVEGGNIEIYGNSTLTSKATVDGTKRGTVQVNKAGTLKVYGGTITSTFSNGNNKGYAISVTSPNNATSAKVTVGQKDGVYDTESIIIEGEGNGIYSDVEYSIYDGMIKGKVAAVNNESKITSIEDDATKVNDEEDGYKRLYYNLVQTSYRIDLDPDGGEVDPTFVTVQVGNSVGTLPTPSKGIYTFDGWYEGDTLITSSTVPTENTTYKARWHYEADNSIQTFNLNTDVLNTYFTRVNTWKQDESTFKSKMDENFNANSCYCRESTCTGGSVHCDKLKGYDTGISDIKLYESSEANKEKGAEVDYVTIVNGTIYNMIPDQTYYWESESDPDVHGYVKPTANRRILNIDGMGNVRDLGGLAVDTDGDGTPDGTIKYGKLFRGERLYSNTTNATDLAKLGVDEEIDLRATSEIASNEAKMDVYRQLETKHYQLNFETQRNNYNLTRNTVKEIMKDVVAGKNIYFHCRIGTDRTGTVAYILEELLGVSEEDILEDYELSYFFGLYNRTRLYSEDPNSSVSKTEKFVYMRNVFEQAGGVYEWYMLGSTNEAEDIELINQFKLAMVE